jgi:pilus assembly protein Flp/PilA
MRCPFDFVSPARAWLKVDSEEGVAAIEYGLLAALIAVGIASAVTLAGTNLTGVFNRVASEIESAAGTSDVGGPTLKGGGVAKGVVDDPISLAPVTPEI